MRRRHPNRSLSLALVFAHVFTFLGPAELLRVGGWRLPVGASPAHAQAAPPPATVGLEAGTNLFAFPREVPPEADTCFELLSFLGGPGVVSRAARLDPLTQQYVECGFAAGGAPAGVDFAVAEGEGYVVDMLAPAQVVLATTASCPALDLEPGVNLVGVSAPFVDQSCFDVLADLGEGTISASERLNRVTGRGEVCAFDPDDGQPDLPGGRDYSIVPGEGYLLHLEEAVSGYQPNDLAVCSGVCGDGVVNLGEECDGANDSMCPGQCSASCTCPALTCQAPDPSQGPPGAVVTLRGTGFLPGSTTVTFNGQPVSPGFASPTRLDVTVPAGVTAGPVDVAVDYPTGTDTVSCGVFTPNAAPTLDPIGDRTVALGQQIEFLVTAADPDGQEPTLTVTPTPLPLGAGFDAETGVFRFQPVAGQGGMSFELTFTASDGQLEASETVSIDVESPPQTTLAGSVLSTSDLCPLEGVVLTAGLDGGPQATVTTDAAGEFFLILDGVPTAPAGLTPMKVDATGPSVVRHCPGGVDTPLNQGPAPDLPLIREATRLLPGAANVVNCQADRLCIDGERPLLLPVLAIAEGNEIDPAVDEMVMSPEVGVCEPDAEGLSERCDPSGDAELQCGPARACLPTGRIEMEVAAGTAKDRTDCTNPLDPQSCADFSGVMSLTPVPNDRSPIDLPPDFDFSVYFAVQPFNVSYDPPQSICIPNVEGFPSGSQLDILAMDPDLGEFIQLGKATVCGTPPPASPPIPPATSSLCSTDNSLICSNGGVVRFGSWHGMVPTPPGPPPDPPPDDPPPDKDPCRRSSRVSMRSGDLQVDHEAPSYRSLGRERPIKLVYHSQHAFPNAFISQQWTPGNTAPPPLNISTTAKLGGIESGGELFYSTDFCTPFSCPFGRFGRALDARAFATGVYPAELTLSCNFPVSRRIDTHLDELPIINRAASAIGAGWWLDGLERVHRSVTGDLFLTTGGTDGIVFTPALQASADIGRPGERDRYRFTGDKGQVVTLRMRRVSDQPDGSSGLDPQLALLDSRGFVVVEDDDSGSGVVVGPGEDAVISAFKLPATDAYTVIASGRGTSVGDYELLLSTAGPTTLVRERVDALAGVQPEFTFDGEIEAVAERVSHDFSGSIGTRVTVEIVRGVTEPDGSGSLDPQVEIRDSRGFLLAADQDGGTNQPPGPGRNALVSLIELPATDRYSITVSGAGSTTGPYEVRVLFDAVAGGVEVVDSGAVAFSEVIDQPIGEFSTLEEKSEGGFLRTMADGTEKHFRDDGLLERVDDADGGTTVYSYDAEGRLLTVTDPASLVTEFVYDAAADSSPACEQALDEIRDPAGRVTRLVHDADCDLVEIVSPDGARRRFEYDDRHLLLRKISARGVATADPDGFATSYTFDEFGRVLSATLPGGAQRQFIGSETQALIEPPESCEGEPAPLGCVGNLAPVQTQLQVDVAFIDGEGRRESFGALASSGAATSLTDNLGRTTTFERDPGGQLTRIDHPTGESYSFQYDDLGRLTSAQSTGAASGTEIRYGDANPPQTDGSAAASAGAIAGISTCDIPSSVTDALGNTTRIETEVLGLFGPGCRITRIISPEGREIAFGYANSTDRDPTTISFAGATTQYLPAAAPATIRTVSQDGVRALSAAYDSAGHLSALSLPGLVVSNEYDRMGRLQRVDLPGPAEATLEHDAEGNLVELNLPRGVHRFNYDERGHRVAYVPPTVDGEDGLVITRYTAESELARIDRASGDSIEYFYDPSGQLSRLLTGPGEYVFEREIDSERLSRVLAPDGQQLTLEYTNGVCSPGPLALCPDVGLIESLTWDGPIAGDVQFSYDEAGRLVGETIDGTGPIERVYDRDGRLTRAGALEIERDPVSGLVRSTRLESGSGTSLVTVAEYNSLLELVEEVLYFVPGAQDDFQELGRIEYFRDDLGRISAQIETIQGETTSIEYRYDSSGALVEEIGNGALRLRLELDAHGNPTRIETDSEAESAEYDARDRLTRKGSVQFSYNSDGQLERRTDLVSGSTTTYEYDPFDNLRSVVLADGRRIDFTNDGFNRRLGKLANGALERGLLYRSQLDPVAELDSESQVVSRFVYGDRANVPAYLVKSEDLYRVWSDARGSPRLIVSLDTGHVAQRIDYNAYGLVLRDSNPGFQPFGFGGGIYEPETGFVRMGARDYDPSAMRWTTRDRLLFSGETINLYRYAFGDPVNVIDPSGALGVTATFGLLLVMTGALCLGGINCMALDLTSSNHPFNPFSPTPPWFVDLTPLLPSTEGTERELERRRQQQRQMIEQFDNITIDTFRRREINGDPPLSRNDIDTIERELRREQQRRQRRQQRCF